MTPAAQTEWAVAELRRARLTARSYADEDTDAGIAAQTSLRTGNLSAPTPMSLPGGARIDTIDLVKLMAGPRAPILIYVQNYRGHVAPTIPGAFWVDGAGSGEWAVQETGKSPARQFRDVMQRLAPDKSAPVVFFAVGQNVGYSTLPHCGPRRSATQTCAGIAAAWRRGKRPAWHWRSARSTRRSRLEIPTTRRP